MSPVRHHRIATIPNKINVQITLFANQNLQEGSSCVWGILYLVIVRRHIYLPGSVSQF